MSTRTAVIPNHTFHSDLFSLSVFNASQKTNIDMSVLPQVLNTADIPQTHQILEKTLPSVLRSQCFNDEGLSFSEEVKRTEIGHLFEHILLEYLCEEKILSGHKKAEFSGVTDWDWKKDKLGTFHITINSGHKHKKILKPALEKTIRLVKKIVSDRFSLNSQTVYFN